MTVTILITRPEPAATRFADQLGARLGDKVVILRAPLMRIDYGGALPDIGGDDVLVFTSRHGVAGFCRLTERRDFTCYAVGDATAEAARRAGLRAISAGGDADALLARIAADGVEGPFLHLRGEHVASDISGGLRQQVRIAKEAVVYRQVDMPLSDQAQALLAKEAPVIVPLMSPRSAQAFFERARGAVAPILVAAISSNAADAVPAGQAQLVEIAQTPDADGVLIVICDLVKRLEGLNPAK
ncbi:uroporphyrinogen-III synthase [Roseovarius sp.]|uniref:uroporphyrinogen-III synthase n=1 Tax=Roseovarius sp. TaxID=1486281 RepID=UPI003A97E750